MKLKNFSLSLGTQIFKAFSDEARVRIIHLLLRQQALTITDLELILDFTQTKTARHVTYLRNSGLLKTKKVDQWVFYSLKEEVHEIVNDMMEFLQKDIQLQKDSENYHIMDSNRELAANKLAAKDYRP
ncbi:MAG: metalloregulator ArsR/SmtB family transcription factor [Cyclobacteriaceae bacterium]